MKIELSWVARRFGSMWTRASAAHTAPESLDSVVSHRSLQPLIGCRLGSVTSKSTRTPKGCATTFSQTQIRKTPFNRPSTTCIHGPCMQQNQKHAADRAFPLYQESLGVRLGYGASLPSPVSRGSGLLRDQHPTRTGGRERTRDSVRARSGTRVPSWGLASRPSLPFLAPKSLTPNL